MSPPPPPRKTRIHKAKPSVLPVLKDGDSSRALECLSTGPTPAPTPEIKRLTRSPTSEGSISSSITSDSVVDIGSGDGIGTEQECGGGGGGSDTGVQDSEKDHYLVARNATGTTVVAREEQVEATAEIALRIGEKSLVSLRKDGEEDKTRKRERSAANTTESQDKEESKADSMSSSSSSSPLNDADSKNEQKCSPLSLDSSGLDRRLMAAGQVDGFDDGGEDADDDASDTECSQTSISAPPAEATTKLNQQLLLPGVHLEEGGEVDGNNFDIDEESIPEEDHFPEDGSAESLLQMGERDLEDLKREQKKEEDLIGGGVIGGEMIATTVGSRDGAPKSATRVSDDMDSVVATTKTVAATVDGDSGGSSFQQQRVEFSEPPAVEHVEACVDSDTESQGVRTEQLSRDRGASDDTQESKNTKGERPANADKDIFDTDADTVGEPKGLESQSTPLHAPPPALTAVEAVLSEADSTPSSSTSPPAYSAPGLLTSPPLSKIDGVMGVSSLSGLPLPPVGGVHQRRGLLGSLPPMGGGRGLSSLPLDGVIRGIDGDTKASTEGDNISDRIDATAGAAPLLSSSGPFDGSLSARSTDTRSDSANPTDFTANYLSATNTATPRSRSREGGSEGSGDDEPARASCGRSDAHAKESEGEAESTRVRVGFLPGQGNSASPPDSPKQHQGQEEEHAVLRQLAGAAAGHGKERDDVAHDANASYVAGGGDGGGDYFGDSDEIVDEDLPEDDSSVGEDISFEHDSSSGDGGAGTADNDRDDYFS